MVTLYGLVVIQTDRIHTLETVAGELAARVHKLENRFTAQGTDEKTTRKTDRVVQEKAMYLRNKVSFVIAKNFVKQ